MASGNALGAASVVEADIAPRIILYKWVADPAARTAAIVEANELIMTIASIQGAPAGSRCHFELESAADRVILSVAGDRFYIGQAAAISRRAGWRRFVSVVETVLVRPIALRTAEPEPAMATANASRNVRRAHGARTTRRASAGFPKPGKLTVTASSPQYRDLPLGDVARVLSEIRIPLRSGRPPRTPENALREGHQVAWEERGTRRNVRGASSSSSNTE